MTDEEMAKEWFNKELYLESSMYNMQIEYYCRQAYLAGLKAGRPQWHKVANGDLPKIGKPCFIYLANDYVIIAKLREDNVWTTNGHNAFENVIAWCEIPTFDKEE